MRKKKRDNPIIFGLFMILVLIYFFGEHLHKLNSNMLWFTCSLFFYILFVLIYLYSKSPYGEEALFDKLFFWMSPVFLGYILSHIIGGYYTKEHGRELPLEHAIIYKLSSSSSKGRTRYIHFINEKGEKDSISVSKKTYEKSYVGGCIIIQYKISSLGVYLDYWKRSKCTEGLMKIPLSSID